jgi:putative transposase
VKRLKSEYPIATLCEVLDYPRSQVYYQAQPVEDDSDIKALITAVAGRYPTDQSLTLTALEKGFQKGCPEIHPSECITS